MSNSNEILKKCCRCEIIQVIEIFNKDKNRKDGLYPLCISCRKDSYFKNLDKIKKYNEYNRERRNTCLKNKRETDVSFRLLSNTRNRIYKSSKCMTKQSSSRDILGIDIETYKKWLEFQFTPEMNWSNTEIDHVEPICMFDVTKDDEFREAFNWKNIQPLLKHDHKEKGTKFNFLDYQIKFFKAYHFLILNSHEG